VTEAVIHDLKTINVYEQNGKYMIRMPLRPSNAAGQLI
jgi:hypothetical protein